jgi:endonuclease YncB( thermonuclease family)
MGLFAATIFLCTPIAVYDGDGPVHCKEGEKVRIAGIAAREIDGTCRLGHPCPRASATQARDALVNVLGGPRGRWKTGHVVVRYPTMKCVRLGQSYGRVVASCTLADGRDLRRVMLRTGTVMPWSPKGS